MNYLWTVFSEIIFSFNFSGWLQFMAIVTVVMLVSSPGFAATVVAVSAKLGIIAHVKDQPKGDQAEG